MVNLLLLILLKDYPHFIQDTALLDQCMVIRSKNCASLKLGNVRKEKQMTSK